MLPGNHPPEFRGLGRSNSECGPISSQFCQASSRVCSNPILQMCILISSTDSQLNRKKKIPTQNNSMPLLLVHLNPAKFLCFLSPTFHICWGPIHFQGAHSLYHCASNEHFTLDIHWNTLLSMQHVAWINGNKKPEIE